MTTDELKDRMKKILEKERTLYELEQAMQEAESGLVKTEVEKKEYEYPERVDHRGEIRKPKSHKVDIGFGIIWALGIVVMIIMLVSGNLGYDQEGRETALLGCAVYGTCAVFCFLLAGIKLGIYKSKREKVRKKDGAVHIAQVKEYHKMVKDEEERYQLVTTTVEQNYKTALQAIHKKLDQPIAEASRDLASCYETEGDFLYPKYRNFVAVCTLYEYLESGRVYTLDGPEGAYNLYEREIRQNAVIYKLEAIRGNLEKIKDNQYRLYQIVEQTNNELKDVRKSVGKISSTTDRILGEAYVMEEITKSIEHMLFWRL